MEVRRNLKPTLDDLLLDGGLLEKHTVVILDDSAYDYFMNYKINEKTLYEKHKLSCDFIMPLSFKKASALLCDYKNVLTANCLFKSDYLIRILKNVSTANKELLDNSQGLSEDFFDSFYFNISSTTILSCVTLESALLLFKLCNVRDIIVYYGNAIEKLDKHYISLIKNMSEGLKVKCYLSKVWKSSGIFEEISNFPRDLIRLVRDRLFKQSKSSCVESMDGGTVNLEGKILYIDQSPWMAYRNKKFIEQAIEKLKDNFAIGYYYHFDCKYAAKLFLDHNLFKILYKGKKRCSLKDSRALMKILGSVLPKYFCFPHAVKVYIYYMSMEFFSDFQCLYLSCIDMFRDYNIHKCVIAFSESLAFAVLKAAVSSNVKAIFMPHAKIDQINSLIKRLPTDNCMYICCNEFFKKTFVRNHLIEASCCKIVNYDAVVSYEAPIRSVRPCRKKLIPILVADYNYGAMCTICDDNNFLADLQKIIKVPQKLNRLYEVRLKWHSSTARYDVLHAFGSDIDKICFPVDTNLYAIAENSAIAVCFNYVGSGTFELFERQIPVITVMTDRTMASFGEVLGGVLDEKNFLQVKSVQDMWEQIKLITFDTQYKQNVIAKQNIAIYGQITPKKFDEFRDIL
jgi:hypothetical protein